MTDSKESRAIDVEDALRCKLFVNRRASAASSIELVRQVTAAKQNRARKVLFLGDIRQDVHYDEALGSPCPEDLDAGSDDLAKIITSHCGAFKKVVCTSSSPQSVGRAALQAGVTTVFVETEDELVAEMRKTARKGSIIGIAYHADRFLPSAVDQVFGTAFLPEGYQVFDGVAFSCVADVGAVAMAVGQGATLLKGALRQSGCLSLPETVNGMDLVAIGRFAYRETKVAAAILPGLVRTISRGAFFCCSELHAVELPSGLDFIGRSAFAQCASLESVIIPAHCRSISRYAFKDCACLRSVVLPRSVCSIGYKAFADCSSELVLTVESGSYAEAWAAEHGFACKVIKDETSNEQIEPLPRNFEEEGLAFNKLANGDLEVAGFAQDSVSQASIPLVVPPSIQGCLVVSVGRRAFAGDGRITSVQLPESVCWIASEAFENCVSLTSVLLPKSLVVVGSRAFAGCPDIVADADYTFSIADGEVTIERFHGQSTTLSIPRRVLEAPVVRISSGAFDGKAFLRHIMLPEGLREIQGEAFARCSGLTEVGIPASVTEIGQAAFDKKTPLVVQRNSYAHIWASVKGNPITLCADPGEEHRRRSREDTSDISGEYSPPFVRETLTIEKLCQIIGVEVPFELLGRKDLILPGANASWSIARRFEAYFDLLGTEKAKAGALAKQPSLAVMGEPYSGDASNVPIIIHPDPIDAFTKVCRWRLSILKDLKIVAITGSQGKTSMKDFISIVLSGAYPTLKSAGNTNTLRGLDSALRKLRPDHRFYIQEIGLGSHPSNNIQYAAAALKPNFTILTNIRDNHLETFGTRERLLENKANLVRELRDGGIAFLNADDKALWEYKSDKKIIYYGIENKRADYRAEDIKTYDGYITFTIVNEGRRMPARLDIIGKHNIYNALAAFALGEAAGIDKGIIIRQLRKLRTFGMRQNYCNIAGYRMYIDCYNSSPESVRQDIETIADISLPTGCRRVVVLGDIHELGEDEVAKHEALADTLIKYKDHIDKVFCYGPLLGTMAERVRQSDMEVFHTEDREELNAAILAYIQEGDLILWKGGHGVRLFLSIDEMFGTSFTINDQDIVSKYGQRIETEEARFALMPEGAQINKWLSRDPVIGLPPSIEDIPLIALGKNSFAESDLESIEIPPTVKNIGFGAFFKNSNLRKVRLPEGLRLIDQSAFNGCILLQEMVIPTGCSHIGKRAFFGCTSLRRIVIPKSVAMIGEQAFEGCPELEVVCMRDSYAEKYAISNSLEYSLIDEALEADQPC